MRDVQQPTPNQLIYPHEKTLKAIMLTLGVIIWLFLIICSLGTFFLYAAAAYLIFLVLHSVLISHVKGSGVRLSPEQFPDLYQNYLACCERLKMPATPRVYILEGGGILNAFATHFLRTHFIVLLTDTLEAMEQHPDGIKFYLGHELGHIKRKHLSTSFLCGPVLWLPLLGAAYSRAQEHTCDFFGTACCANTENAARALAALAVGKKRWKTLNLNAYLMQNNETNEFWMSLNEVTGGYPWLSKRIALVLGEERTIPSRHPLAYVLGLFVPFIGKSPIVTALVLYFYVTILLGFAGYIYAVKHNPYLFHSPSVYQQSQELSN